MRSTLKSIEQSAGNFGASIRPPELTRNGGLRILRRRCHWDEKINSLFYSLQLVCWHPAPQRMPTTPLGRPISSRNRSPLKEMLYKSHIALRIPSFHRGSRRERPARPGRRGQRHLQSWRSRDRDRQSFAQNRQLPGTHDQDHSPLRGEDLGRARRRSGGLIQRTATNGSAADFTDYADGAQLIPLTRAIRVIREIRG